ncbi:unnamed protein product, partial [Didymodactylos carnosus]
MLKMAKFFKNKAEVDNFVQLTLIRLRTDLEKDTRGYQFAKHYYDVNEYDLAEVYLKKFILRSPESANAYDLMGDICFSKQNYSDALNNYENLFNFLAVNSMLELNQIPLDRARKFIDIINRTSPDDNLIKELRIKIDENNTLADPDRLKTYLKEKLNDEPLNIQLRQQLINVYLRSKNDEDAFLLLMETIDNDKYDHNLEWNKFCLKIIQDVQIVDRTQHVFCSYLCYVRYIETLFEIRNETDLVENLKLFDRFVKINRMEIFSAYLKSDLYFFIGMYLLFVLSNIEHMNDEDKIAQYQSNLMESSTIYFLLAQKYSNNFNEESENNEEAFTLCSTTYMLKHNVQRSFVIGYWLRTLEQSIIHNAKKRKANDLHAVVKRFLNIDNIQESFILSVNDDDYYDGLSKEQLSTYDGDDSNELQNSRDIVLHDVLTLHSLHKMIWFTSCSMDAISLIHKYLPKTIPLSTNDPSVVEYLTQMDLITFLYFCYLQYKTKFSKITGLYPHKFYTNFCSKAHTEWWVNSFRVSTNEEKENYDGTDNQQRTKFYKGLLFLRLQGDNPFFDDIHQSSAVFNDVSHVFHEECIRLRRKNDHTKAAAYDNYSTYYQKLTTCNSNTGKTTMSKTPTSNDGVTSSTSFHTPTTPLTGASSSSGGDGNNTLLEFPKFSQHQSNVLAQNRHVSTTNNDIPSSTTPRRETATTTTSEFPHDLLSSLRRPQHHVSEQPSLSPLTNTTQQARTKTTVNNFNERVNEQLLNCLNIQTNVIQNLTQYSQHISLQLFEIKNIVEMLCNRILIQQQQQQQQQQHVPQQPNYSYYASQFGFTPPQLLQHQQYIRQPFVSAMPPMQQPPLPSMTAFQNFSSQPPSMTAFQNFSSQPPSMGIHQIPSTTSNQPSFTTPSYHQTSTFPSIPTSQPSVLKPHGLFVQDLPTMPVISQKTEANVSEGPKSIAEQVKKIDIAPPADENDDTGGDPDESYEPSVTFQPIVKLAAVDVQT